jgi:hypothetical protein
MGNVHFECHNSDGKKPHLINKLFVKVKGTINIKSQSFTIKNSKI